MYLTIQIITNTYFKSNLFQKLYLKLNDICAKLILKSFLGLFIHTKTTSRGGFLVNAEILVVNCFNYIVQNFAHSQFAHLGQIEQL